MGNIPRKISSFLLAILMTFTSFSALAVDIRVLPDKDLTEDMECIDGELIEGEITDNTVENGTDIGDTEENGTEDGDSEDNGTEDNKLDWTYYSFSNSPTDFFNENEEHLNYIDDEDIEKFADNITKLGLNDVGDTYLSYLRNFSKIDSWVGSCYGMGVTEALLNGGYYSLSDLGLDIQDNDLSKAPMPKDNPKLRSFINYYNLTQHIFSDKIYWGVKTDDHSIYPDIDVDWTEDIMQMVDEVRRGPVLLTYYLQSPPQNTITAHTVIVESVKSETDERIELEAADSNNPGEKVVITVNIVKETLLVAQNAFAKRERESISRKMIGMQYTGDFARYAEKMPYIESASDDSKGLSHIKPQVIVTGTDDWTVVSGDETFAKDGSTVTVPSSILSGADWESAGLVYELSDDTQPLEVSSDGGFSIKYLNNNTYGALSASRGLEATISDDGQIRGKVSGDISISGISGNGMFVYVSGNADGDLDVVPSETGLLITAPAGDYRVRYINTDGSEKALTVMSNGLAPLLLDGKDGNNGSGGNSGGPSGGWTMPDKGTVSMVPGGMLGVPNVAKYSNNGTVKNDTMTFIITGAMVKKVITEVKKINGEKAVIFDISNSVDYRNIHVSLEQDAIFELYKANFNFTQIDAHIFDLTLDSKAIDELKADTQGTITIAVDSQDKLSNIASTYTGDRPAYSVQVSESGKKGREITSLKNGTVTFGIRYSTAPDEHAASLCAVKTETSGKAEIIADSGYNNGRITFSQNSFGIFCVAYENPAASYTDIAEHWGKQFIDFATSRKLIAGINAVEFAPDVNINRGDFLMALGILSGVDVGGYKESSFTDVNRYDDTMPYIEWAVEHEIVRGVGDNKFAPDNDIKREEIAVMIVNFSQTTGYTLPESHGEANFNDEGIISDWAKSAVADIQKSGVIEGKGDNMFDPKSGATRAEACALIKRFVEIVVNEGAPRGWVRNAAEKWTYIDAYGMQLADCWAMIGGSWFYFQIDGTMAVNTIIDGYRVGEDGARIDR